VNDNFWRVLERLVTSSRITIDRPKGSVHPRFAEIVYPLDYGFLEATTAGDGDGIDVFVGSLESQGSEAQVTGAIMTVDLEKRDAEMKVLVGCSKDEMHVVHEFLNSSQMGGALLVRGEG
jgi:inorganic pyrophosphatase